MRSFEHKDYIISGRGNSGLIKELSLVGSKLNIIINGGKSTSHALGTVGTVRYLASWD